MRPTNILFMVLIISTLASFACVSGNPVPAGEPPQSIEPADVPAEVGETDTPDESGITDTQATGPDLEPGETAEAGLPEGWRDDVPLMPGFTVLTFNADNGGMLALCEGPVAVSDAVTFYENIEGWEIDVRANDPSAHIEFSESLAFRKDQWNLSIWFADNDGSTGLNILVINR